MREVANVRPLLLNRIWQPFQILLRIAIWRIDTYIVITTRMSRVNILFITDFAVNPLGRYHNVFPNVVKVPTMGTCNKIMFTNSAIQILICLTDRWKIIIDSSTHIYHTFPDVKYGRNWFQRICVFPEKTCDMCPSLVIIVGQTIIITSRATHNW